MMLLVSIVFSLPQLEIFNGNYGSSLGEHKRFGWEQGLKFKKGIQARLDGYEALESTLLPYFNTPEGRAVYDDLISLHSELYPNYMAEIEGIAKGAEVPFSTLFIMNVREEYSILMNMNNETGVGGGVDLQCSDYLVHTETEALSIHNEDSGFYSVGRTFFMNVTIDNDRFLAYVYMGDLASGAFGLNSAIAYTVNYVEPTWAEVGIGRGFATRELLRAQTYAEALHASAPSNFAGGHNYQLIDIHHQTLTNVEVGPGGIFTELSVQAGRAGDKSTVYFHANTYQRLLVDGELISQPQDPGSAARLDRVADLPVPQSQDDLRAILGDGFNQTYPIYHDKTSHFHGDKSNLWTLCTVLYDVSAKVGTIYVGNPQDQNEVIRFSMTSLELL